MKKIIILICVCLVLAVNSCGSKLKDPSPLNDATAIVTKEAAEFYFPVENANQIWWWNFSGRAELEYAWDVQINILNKPYVIGFSKWQNDESSKGFGMLGQLLFAGQVDIWEPNPDGTHSGTERLRGSLTISKKGSGVVIRLTTPKFLDALKSEKPKDAIFRVKGAMFNFPEEKTVNIVYKD